MKIESELCGDVKNKISFEKILNNNNERNALSSEWRRA